MPSDGTVTITVKLFASFRRGRFLEASRDYPTGARVADVVADLGIEPGDIGMIFIDGKRADPDRVLSVGDRLALFPLLGGG
ncbi:MAG: MoaD/ThiS family protein [Xanthobacteraceae bacterium]|nr:MoaD/ThiS family protein [Xanthobacteraceae bacterium]